MLLQTIFAGSWGIAYHLRGEHQITRNQHLTTLPLLEKEWRVSFDFKANSFDGWGQIIHMTTGGPGTVTLTGPDMKYISGYGNSAKYGDRTPAIWTHPSKGFHIASAVKGQASYGKSFMNLPAIGEWVKVEIAQEVQVSTTFFSIALGGEKVHMTRNSKPSRFNNVSVLSSSSWYTPVSGTIKNLLIENKKNGGSYCKHYIHNSNLSYELIFQVHGISRTP